MVTDIKIVGVELSNFGGIMMRLRINADEFG